MFLQRDAHQWLPNRSTCNQLYKTSLSFNFQRATFCRGRVTIVSTRLSPDVRFQL